MTTRDALVSEIEDELNRSDLTTYVTNQVTRAIDFFKKETFSFKSKFDLAFTCVAGQVYYDEDDDADIGLIYQLKKLQIRVSNNDYDLHRMPIARFELLNDGNVSNGQPHSYTYENDKIGLYPPPSTTYVVTMIGIFHVSAPASGAEADNPWMTKAYDLIKYRVLERTWRYKIRNTMMADQAKNDMIIELNQLRAETSKKKGTGLIVPSQF